MQLGTTIAGSIAIVAIATATIVKFPARGPRVLWGPTATVGGGAARLFVELDSKGTPQVIGISMSEKALAGLPSHMNMTSRCFDKDANGHLSHGECMGDYETTLLPPSGIDSLRLPVGWATVNWNPEGHAAPAPPVWSAPHFDFHFFTTERSVIDGIRPGTCGELIDCEDFKTATQALPEKHLPQDYLTVGAAVPAMGNHLIDSKDPELADPSLGFTKTFIYGSWAGRIIFLEPMVSRKYLETRPNECLPVKSPQAWEKAGYYPTRYCVRHNAENRSYRVTLEGLVYRQAS